MPELPLETRELFSLVYQELRKLAAHKMAHEAAGQTLQPTALVHEVWLRLDREGDPQWKNRAQFFSAAGEAMRRILIEKARSKLTEKRGAGRAKEPLDHFEIDLTAPSEQVLAVHEALDELEMADPESAQLVKLRYFVGLSVDEAAECLGISPRKATYVWAYARKWLRLHLSTD